MRVLVGIALMFGLLLALGGVPNLVMGLNVSSILFAYGVHPAILLELFGTFGLGILLIIVGSILVWRSLRRKE